MQKLEIQHNYKHLKGEIKTIISNFKTSGSYVVKGERNSIKRFEVEGLSINVKEFKIPNNFNAIVYKYFRDSKAERSFDYANYLISKGIKTPFPVAYFEETSVFGLKRSFYLSLHIDYDFDFRDLIHKPKFPNRDEILRQFTAFTFKLHKNDIEFLDHSPGNTLIVDNGKKQYDFYLIDLNRMRFKSLSFEQRIYNFRRLWLSKRMLVPIAEKYSQLSQKSYAETYELLLKSSRKFQRIKNAKKLRKLGRRPKFKS